MDIWEFILALVTDWVALMSGIASVILSILGLTRKWQQVPNWVWWSAAAICFLFANARIWTTEHRARIDAENKLTVKENEHPKPDLVGEIQQTLWVDAKPNSVLFALIRIKNVGSLPSITEGFHFIANAANIEQAPTVFPREGIKVNNLQQQRIAEFHPDNDITTRIMNPIMPGSALVGWLYFVIPHTDTEKMMGVEKEIKFFDILGRAYVAQVPNPGPSGLFYFPGSGGNPFKVDSLPYRPKQP